MESNDIYMAVCFILIGIIALTLLVGMVIFLVLEFQTNIKLKKKYEALKEQFDDYRENNRRMWLMQENLNNHVKGKK